VLTCEVFTGSFFGGRGRGQGIVQSVFLCVGRVTIVIVYSEFVKLALLLWV